jgi:D-lactate dehydrogenase (cytochrome)
LIGITTTLAAFTTWKVLSPQSKDASTNSTLPLASMAPAQYNLTPHNIQAAQRELESLLGAQHVTTAQGELIQHSSTSWSTAPGGTADIANMIVYPSSTTDVSAIARICHARRLPMVGFSGGTSLEASLAMVTRGGVCIDFGRMDRVVGVHEDDMDVVVQPGVGYLELNEILAEHGLYFPPDPGPGAKIGGMVSQSCSGTNAYRYGTMRAWVLGLTVVLADGTVIKTRGRPRKSNAGYDLGQLIIGSEGTLGLITEISLKVTKKPENERVAVLRFANVHDAVGTAVRIVKEDMPVAAIELMDDNTMKAVNLAGHSSKAYPEGPHLFLKFAGPLVTVNHQIASAKKWAKENGCSNFELSSTSEEADSLWQARKTALWSLFSLKKHEDDVFLSSDAAVPVSRLADLIDYTHNIIEESGYVAACLGHVGDGNFHAGMFFPPEDSAKGKEVLHKVQQKAIEMGGTITGEHGIGYEYRDALEEELGAETVDAMRQIKKALDPLCLLNPDKVFRVKYQSQR